MLELTLQCGIPSRKEKVWRESYFSGRQNQYDYRHYKASSDFPDGLEITTTADTSRVTKSQVANLENSIISGVILVVLVLFVFLDYATLFL